MKKINVNYALCIVFLVLFLALTLCVSAIDVQAIGPEDSEIGLAGVNGFFRDLFGTNDLWYDITEIFGYASLASAGIFACLGLYQLITRKSLKKIDLDIYALAGLYLLVMAAYVFFEIVVINRRPVLVDGELEASFPSSHTMIVICFLSGAIHQIQKRIKNKPACIASTAVLGIMIVLTVVGRMICGVHWFTDILAGVLLGLAIVFLYVGAANQLSVKE